MHHRQREPHRDLSFSLGTPPLLESRTAEKTQSFVGINPREILVVSLSSLNTGSATFLPLTPREFKYVNIVVAPRGLKNISTRGTPRYILSTSA